jgi:hypothetical protein
MEIVNTVITAAIVAAVGILLAWHSKGRFDALERRIDGIESRLGGIESRMGGIENRMGGIEGRLGGIEGRTDGLRSDLTRVALAVGAALRAENA